MTNETTHLKGRAIITLTRPDGTRETRQKDNLITNAGFDFLCSAIASPTRPNAMNYTAVGTGTTDPSAAQTALAKELTRKSATYAHTSGTKELTLTTTFGAGEATGAITEAGIVNASSGGTLFDRVTFAVINKGAQDELTTKFVFTLS